MLHRRIAIAGFAAGKPGDDGVVPESLLIPERRSRKVGILPTRARFVLEAARKCFDHDSRATAEVQERSGVSLGTVFGSMDSTELCLLTPRGSGFREVTPSWYATGLASATAGIVASIYELQGPNLTVMGYQSGVEAIIMACRQIRAGRASAMLAGGFDLPSERFTSWLQDSPVYAEAPTIHPGVGLVWLSAGQEWRTAAATIAGWSQTFIAPDDEPAGHFPALIEQAARNADLCREPIIHFLHPGRKGRVDYLAATAPIHLVETVIANEPPGVHAVIVKGFGRSLGCLLVEKHG
jgi:3-oxoacyl-[acyl-carrier-protein] synthase II